MEWGNFHIYTDKKHLDAENKAGTRRGYLEIWGLGKDTIYSIKGDLPLYVERKLAELAEARGYKYWFNCASYFDV